MRGWKRGREKERREEGERWRGGQKRRGDWGEEELIGMGWGKRRVRWGEWIQGEKEIE